MFGQLRGWSIPEAARNCPTEIGKFDHRRSITGPELAIPKYSPWPMFVWKHAHPCIVQWDCMLSPRTERTISLASSLPLLRQTPLLHSPAPKRKIITRGRGSHSFWTATAISVGLVWEWLLSSEYNRVLKSRSAHCRLIASPTFAIIRIAQHVERD